MFEYRISLAKHREPPKITYFVTIEEDDMDLAKQVAIELSKRHEGITKFTIRKKEV